MVLTSNSLKGVRMEEEKKKRGRPPKGTVV